MIGWPAIYHLAGFARWRLRRRNPGPPPFSSMNAASCQKDKSKTALRALFLRAFAKADAGAAAVLVDEVDLTALDSRMPVEQINQRRTKLETGVENDKAPVLRSGPSS
jgi:hypothetical protein